MSYSKLERLYGIVERVTFHSEESGFCVLRIKVKSARDLVTVVGNAAKVTAGEYLECSGEWWRDKKHGMQFKAQELKLLKPTTLEGIEKYLGSGLIRGVGPHYAKKLVKAFGEKVLDIIEEQPELLYEVPGIGKKRAQGIADSWQEQKVVREIMLFLQSHGVGTARAVRIYKTYGDNAIEVVRENPYRLSLDIRGIGFKTADMLAKNLGISEDALIRAQAGLHHVLNMMCEEGHTAIYSEELLAKSAKLLEISLEKLADALELEVAEKRLIFDEIENKKVVFLANLFYAEENVARKLYKLLDSGKLPQGKIDLTGALKWIEQNNSLALSKSQQEAIKLALQHKVVIITGGPGVGKTTIVQSILQIIKTKISRIALCAPTGRAAKRMSETTSYPAKTIHRLLEFDAKTFNFRFNAKNPLPYDFIIADEVSMLDLNLFNKFINAIHPSSVLLLVGDVDQLPSIGSGAILHDLIESQVIPTARLNEVFRQAKTSRIVTNAHLINSGKMPHNSAKEESDFYTLLVDEPEEIAQKLVGLITKRIPKKYNLDPTQAIQVLTPMNRGALGVTSLNVLLQKELNPKLNQEKSVTKFGITFATGDKVMQMVNNYDKDVFNGDIGFIVEVDLVANVVMIDFDGKVVEYDVNELDEINLAYACSIHKSQGSEYPIVIIPLAMQHYMLLARNLLYTAVTRGKKLVIVIAQKKALAIAVNNANANQRLTKLKSRLQTLALECKSAL